MPIKEYFSIAYPIGLQAIDRVIWLFPWRLERLRARPRLCRVAAAASRRTCSGVSLRADEPLSVTATATAWIAEDHLVFPRCLASSWLSSFENETHCANTMLVEQIVISHNTFVPVAASFRSSPMSEYADCHLPPDTCGGDATCSSVDLAYCLRTPCSTAQASRLFHTDTGQVSSNENGAEHQ